MSDRVIHIKPHYCDIKATDEGFELTFIGNTVNKKRYRIVFKCGLWWVRYMARGLRKLIAQKKADIADIERDMDTK